VLALACSRPNEPGDENQMIAALAVELAPSVLLPAPLSEKATAAIVREELGETADHDLCLSCHKVTGGNPFLIRELSIHLREVRGDGTSISPQAITDLGPERIAQGVLLRVGRIGASAPAFAQAISVLGDGAELEQAAVLAGIEPDEARGIADALRDASILAPGSALGFVHPLVRTAVHEDIPPAKRGDLHARAGALLHDRGADAAVIAAHLLQTEPRGDRGVVERLWSAAAQALAQGAPEGAVAYLRRAVSEKADDPPLGELMHELGRAEVVARDPAAISDLQEALKLAEDAATRSRVTLDLVEILAFAGEWEIGMALVESSLAQTTGTDTDPEIHLELEAFRAGYAMYDVNGVQQFNRDRHRLDALARRSEGRGALALRSVLASGLALRGAPREQALSLVEPAVSKGRVIAERGSESVLVPQAMTPLILLEELDRADVFIESIFDDARKRGSLFGFLVGLGMRALLHDRRGSLSSAEADVRAVLEQVPPEAMAIAIPTTLQYCINTILERAQLADAMELAEHVVLPPAFLGTQAAGFLLEARGTFRLARGKRASGISDLHAAGAIFGALDFGPRFSRWRSTLALALREENHEEAAELVSVELQLARDAASPRGEGCALRTLGLLEGGEVGADLLRQALVAFENVDAAYERARTQFELGAALRRANQRGEARELLLSTLDLAHRCGAERLQAQVLDELKVVGTRPRRRSITGRDSLTPSELRVAAAAAEGASNREIAQSLFVTLRTIEMHLSNAYRKLQIGSRSELPQALEAKRSE
jgi:DNA-binding CsgD family transcriptional regulator